MAALRQFSSLAKYTIKTSSGSFVTVGGDGSVSLGSTPSVFTCEKQATSIAFRAPDGLNYLTVGADGKLAANDNGLGPNTTYTPGAVSGGHSLQSPSNSQFVSANGSTLEANKTSVSPTETFVFTKQQ
eukprot:TRINITY_DN15288_c0_g1_i1.p1 TRINITY_DN15288_c0_g1~~TRINITY_DN15288_c0_g1_i1.p1  ORF type:complete len:128 (+),score=27.14 TRINITY_DN15288_c0_g1_i1:58-441(+)